MINKIKNNHSHTIYASYIGYITQAIVNNFVPLLFLTFVNGYGLTLAGVTLITTVNFLVQLVVDLLSAKLIDKIGCRKSIIAAHIFVLLGLLGLALLPDIIGNIYVGIMISVVLYAIGGGVIEVLVSPIVEACPTEKKEAAMSLLHSFYCWGHLLVVIVSTVFFRLFGIESWRVMACIWAAVPLLNAVYFSFVPIYPVAQEHEKLSLSGLARQKIFWVLMLLMFCAGASEQAISQWASAFAELGLGVSKAMGDLLGPCAFALLMGISRAFYGRYSERVPLKRFMFISTVMCIACYIVSALSPVPFVGLVGCALCGFSVGILWPGTFSIAARKISGGGTAMYALMALAGDVGCSAGPTLVGLTAAGCSSNLNIGIIAAIVFPVLMLIGLCAIKK